MKVEQLIKAISADMKNKREDYYLFDDDEVAEQIIKHFKQKGYKVSPATNYGVISIKKRWWQR